MKSSISKMRIEPLPWDSNFFGLRVGKATVDASESKDVLSKSLDLANGYDLIYIFSDRELSFEIDGARLVDKKIVYNKPVQNRGDIDPNVVIYQGSVPNEKLYDLAIQSGAYSRFKIDRRFPEGSFERLYHRWIEQSVSGKMSDAVLCVEGEDNLVGMLTLGIEESVGRIGLTAVDINSQRKGYGSVLLNAAEKYLFDKQIQEIEVATQQDNIKACRWYEKNGFAIKTITCIYHLWV